jgi:hypothetical protein
MAIHARRLAWLFVLFAVLPSRVAAQPSTPSGAPREGVAIGIALTPTWTGGVEFWPSVRLSVPLMARIGLDMDAGRPLSATNAYFSSEAIYAVGVRFLRSRRAAAGSSSYWSLGPAFITGESLDGEDHVTDPNRVVPAIKLGYGGDQIFRNGTRMAAEVGVIGGGGDSPTGIYGTLVVQWQPRR